MLRGSEEKKEEESSEMMTLAPAPSAASVTL